jgi:hypothetical protein
LQDGEKHRRLWRFGDVGGVFSIFRNADHLYGRAIARLEISAGRIG